MNIGITGTGKMGRALGLRWSHQGHPVLFGSRDVSKAKTVAATGSRSAQAGTFEDAAEFGEVILYTVRGVFPSTLLRNPRALAGKVVIDCNNTDLGDDSRSADFRFDAPTQTPSLTERLASDVPDARVVKAFNTIPSPVIELPRNKLAPHGISVFLCSDDASAKRTVKELAEELGFVAVDSGGLERARLLDGVTDFIRFQIGVMGLGMFTTISIHRLEER